MDTLADQVIWDTKYNSNEIKTQLYTNWLLKCIHESVYITKSQLLQWTNEYVFSTRFTSLSLNFKQYLPQPTSLH